ncbi:MAG: signal peptidase I [Ruminococcus sp.]|nr:signal peptidase I [Ruminococcus sp.]
MNKIIKNTLKAINFVIVAIVVLLAVLILGTKAIGWQMYTVLSGSMEPDYPTGSLILVKDAEPEELVAGDVITYKLSGGTIATHRIVEVLSEGGEISFRTKGDANEQADAALTQGSAVIGTPVFMIPKAGIIANYVQSPEGRPVVITVGAALILFVFATDFLIKDKKQTKQKDSENDNIKEKENSEDEDKK